MDIKATVTLANGQRVKGRFTTTHPASSYNQPVFVGYDNVAYNWAEIVNVITTDAQSKGGSRSKPEASRANGRKGGRPRKNTSTKGDIK